MKSANKNEPVPGDMRRRLESFAWKTTRSTLGTLDFIEQNGEPDLVFSDVMLPGEMNGVDKSRRPRSCSPAVTPKR